MALVPVENNNKEETFKHVGTMLKLDDKVVKLLLGNPMSTLEDLRFWFNLIAQLAVRRAWSLE